MPTLRPFRLIIKNGELLRLRFSDVQPLDSFLLQNVTGADGLLLPEYRKYPIFQGKRQYGTPPEYVKAVLALKKKVTKNA